MRRSFVRVARAKAITLAGSRLHLALHLEPRRWLTYLACLRRGTSPRRIVRAQSSTRAVFCASLVSRWQMTSKSVCGTARLKSAISFFPERPPGTEAMTEEQLTALVTRDAMVGVAKVSRPSGGPA